MSLDRAMRFPATLAAGAGAGLVGAATFTLLAAFGQAQFLGWDDWGVTLVVAIVALSVTVPAVLVGLLAAWVAGRVIGSPNWWTYGLLFAAVFCAVACAVTLPFAFTSPEVAGRAVAVLIVAESGVGLICGLLIGRFLAHR